MVSFSRLAVLGSYSAYLAGTDAALNIGAHVRATAAPTTADEQGQPGGQPPQQGRGSMYDIDVGKPAGGALQDAGAGGAGGAQREMTPEEYLASITGGTGGGAPPAPNA